MLFIMKPSDFPEEKWGLMRTRANISPMFLNALSMSVFFTFITLFIPLTFDL